MSVLDRAIVKAYQRHRAALASTGAPEVKAPESLPDLKQGFILPAGPQSELPSHSVDPLATNLDTSAPFVSDFCAESAESTSIDCNLGAPGGGSETVLDFNSQTAERTVETSNDQSSFGEVEQAVLEQIPNSQFGEVFRPAVQDHEADFAETIFDDLSAGSNPHSGAKLEDTSSSTTESKSVGLIDSETNLRSNPGPAAMEELSTDSPDGVEKGNPELPDSPVHHQDSLSVLAQELQTGEQIESPAEAQSTNSATTAVMISNGTPTDLITNTSSEPGAASPDQFRVSTPPHSAKSRIPEPIRSPETILPFGNSKRHPVQFDSIGDRSLLSITPGTESHLSKKTAVSDTTSNFAVEDRSSLERLDRPSPTESIHFESQPAVAAASSVTTFQRPASGVWNWPEICEQLDQHSGDGFKQLAKQLQLTAQQGKRVLAFVSPSRNSGRTTILMTLARILARDPHTEALLIDLDRRHPEIAALVKYEAKRGVKDILENPGLIGSVIAPMTPGKISLMPLTESISDTEWIKYSGNIAPLITQAKRAYDMVLIDAGVFPVGTRLSDCWLKGCVDAVVTVSRQVTTSGRQNLVLDWKQIGIESLGFIETFS